MTKPEMFSRSLLVQGPQDTLTRFATAFDIAPAHVFDENAPNDFGYLQTHHPALTHGTLRGDFTLYLEPTLWDTDPETFDAALRTLSRQGIAIALPDEGAASPLRFVLFLNGDTQHIDIDEDEVFDENFIVGNAALRKRLSTLARIS